MYTVKLTASNTNGNSSKTATINVSQDSSLVLPVANFSSSVSEGSAPLTVQFSDLSENAAECHWDFGDGKTSTERNPTNVYSAAGTYTVSLTASNANGTSSSTSSVYVMPNISPVANFSSNVSEGPAPLTVQFNDLSENATGVIWDFDNNGVIDSTDRNPIYTYTSAGVYTVNLTAFNANGAKQILDNCDSLGFNDYDYRITRTIDTTSKVEGTGSYKCVSTGTGTAYMLLQNTSRWNLSSAGYVEANIKAPSGKLMAFRLFSNMDDDYVSYYFTANGSWQHIKVPFKDLHRTGNFNPGSVYHLRIDIISSDVGDTYYVDSITTDAYVSTSDSKSDTINVDITNVDTINADTINVDTINVVPAVFPVANFSSNVSEGSAPLAVKFTDLSENAAEWHWDFGDGKASTERNPTNVYSTEGNYTVNLTVSNANGTNSKLAAITISEEPLKMLPVANFSSNVSEGSAPLTVQFTDFSENATGVIWDFGDRISSTDPSPVHTFSDVGNYTVNLTVSNANGINSTTRTINVTSPVLPAADLTTM
ncbi:hypothetical protein SDC9_98664 [bioreactor metagenome]|uniref:PKD domain-containing protein n=1 Tax=bioreactor metagenome TaxID=1076179 RepID=A0A645AFD0_9ZZZZ